MKLSISRSLLNYTLSYWICLIQMGNFLTEFFSELQNLIVTSDQFFFGMFATFPWVFRVDIMLLREGKVILMEASVILR